jgi:ataxia telangiectasia mutated family protein
VDPRHEHQVQTVVENLRLFSEWLEKYLNSYNSPVLIGKPLESFQRMTGSIQVASGQGLGSTNVSESELLLEVLRDRESKSSLLSKPISDRVISLLCAASEGAVESHLTSVERDEDAISNATTVFQILQEFTPGPEYRSWAARVIGRAFAATGEINGVLLREQELGLFQLPLPHSAIDVLCRSKANIIQLLCDALQSSSQTGVVERTLQLIMSNLANFPDFESCASGITSSLMKALTWNPYQCPGIPFSALEAKNRESVQGWDLSLSSSEWARTVEQYFISQTGSSSTVITVHFA